MPRFLLCHRHEPTQCSVAFAAWRGFESPLRRRAALVGCLHGEHAAWWVAEAADAHGALAQLPAFVADRTTAIRVAEWPTQPEKGYR